MDSHSITKIRPFLAILLACLTVPPLSAQQTITLRGRITGLKAGGIPQGVVVALAQVGPTPVNPDGTFEIRGVPTGKRDVTLLLSRLGISATSGQTNRSRLSTTVVSVDNSDIANIELQWLPLASITAELVEVDKDGKRVSTIESDEAVLQIKSVGGRPIAGGCDFPGCAKDQVTIRVSPRRPPASEILLPPGAYNLQAEKLPGGYSIKSVNVGNVNVQGKPFEIDSDTFSIKVEVLMVPNN